jgi:arylsulfate sulfotransferase
MSLNMKFVGCVAMSGLLAFAGNALAISDLKITLNPSGNAPLSADATFTSNEPGNVTIAISDGVNESEIKWGGTRKTEFSVPVLGMRPGKEHTITISVTNSDGSTASAPPVTLTTAPLPDDFPPLSVEVRRSRRMEPGVSLIPVSRWSKTTPDEDYGLVFALDNKGDVIWYYRTDHMINEAVRISTGNLLYTAGRDGRLFEIDMLGNVVQRWHTTGVPKENIPASSTPVAIDTFHHDVIEMPSGNFMALGTEVRDFDDYPSSMTNPNKRKPSQVIGDTIVEFKRDGSIVREFKLMDILDPYRVHNGSLGTGFYAAVYEDVLEAPARDWGHFNAIVYDERDDSVLLSSYHQGAAFKVSLATGELIWILGESKNWRAPWLAKRLKPATEGMMLNSRQHGITLLPDDSILMFDNGGYRKGPLPAGAPKYGNFSRAVNFEINEMAGTVRTLWEFGGAEDNWFFSTFVCDTDYMPETGNILITDGGRIKDKDGNDTGSFVGRHWARIIEVTHDTPAQKVFELHIEEPSVGWAIYRSERLPSLYP